MSVNSKNASSACAVRKVTIEVIPHNSQRYNTCGDWQLDPEGHLTIKVSNTPQTGWRGSMLIAVHELVEALLCADRGITTETVDRFDLAFDPLVHDYEPGDDPACPCQAEHNIATSIERALLGAFHMKWLPYDSELSQMTEDYPKRALK